MSKIPLIKTYPKEPKNNSPLWFAPKILGILPNDVRVHTTMYGELDIARTQSKSQHHFQQFSHHLTQLDNLIATLYIAHNTTIPKPPVAELIPRLPIVWHLINKACTSWQWGIEQITTTAKLVTARCPHSTTPPQTDGKLNVHTDRNRGKIASRIGIPPTQSNPLWRNMASYPSHLNRAIPQYFRSTNHILLFSTTSRER